MNNKIFIYLFVDKKFRSLSSKKMLILRKWCNNIKKIAFAKSWILFVERELFFIWKMKEAAAEGYFYN